MNRLIAEALACLIIAALFFMCGFLLGGVRFGVFHHAFRGNNLKMSLMIEWHRTPQTLRLLIENHT